MKPRTCGRSGDILLIPFSLHAVNARLDGPRYASTYQPFIPSIPNGRRCRSAPPPSRPSQTTSTGGRQRPTPPQRASTTETIADDWHRRQERCLPAPPPQRLPASSREHEAGVDGEVNGDDGSVCGSTTGLETMMTRTPLVSARRGAVGGAEVGDDNGADGAGGRPWRRSQLC